MFTGFALINLKRHKSWQKTSVMTSGIHKQTSETIITTRKKKKRNKIRFFHAHGKFLSIQLKKKNNVFYMFKIHILDVHTPGWHSSFCRYPGTVYSLTEQALVVLR